MEFEKLDIMSAINFKNIVAFNKTDEYSKSLTLHYSLRGDYFELKLESKEKSANMIFTKDQIEYAIDLYLKYGKIDFDLHGEVIKNQHEKFLSKIWEVHEK